jgi:hypothetical protein
MRLAEKPPTLNLRSCGILVIQRLDHMACESNEMGA